MKKTLLALAFVLLTMVMLCLVVSAETITVVDDGTTEITLGECIIEGLDKELPDPSKGFTYELNTENGTAKITKWANVADDTLGREFCVPSTVTYGGNTYTVTNIFALGNPYSSNYTLVTVAIPDTVTSIPENAFYNFRALKYVYVGSGVQTIGSSCFSNAGFTANDSIDSVTGEAKGNIRDFIWKTKSITTLSKECFFHMDFETGYTIEFPFENITVYESSCLAYNQHAFQTGHKFNNQLFLDAFDITGATSVATDAFNNSVLGKVIVVRADQLNALNPLLLRGQGTAQPVKYCDFVIVGGETRDTAVTLPSSVWTANAWYWGSPQPHYNIIFKGYVNAYDGIDGLENQNGYGADVVDYFFESEDAFRHYVASIDSTTERVNTYTRYAKNTKGYFNVCVNGAEHSFKAYNLTYTPASEGVEESIEIVEYAQTSFAFGYPQQVTVLDDDCTPSTLCWCCDTVLVKGIEHTLKTTIKYENGYLSAGIRAAFCENDGCEYCKNSEETAPLFVNLGFSYGPDSILQGFVVNRDALSAYTQINGDKSVKYGVIVGSVNRIGEKETLFDNELNVIDGAHNVSFDDKEFDMFVMKVTGLETDEYKSYELYLCAYVIEDGVVTYINNGTESKAISTISHNALTTASPNTSDNIVY